MTSRNAWTGSVLGWSLCILVLTTTVCSCRSSFGDPAQLWVVFPSDGAALTRADDRDPARAGVQVDVQVNATGLGTLAAISLLIDDQPVALASADLSGRAVFAGVTLPWGTHQLVARTVNGSLRSPVTTYTLSGLLITDPENNAQLTGINDEDPLTPHIQRGVRVRTHGVTATESVTLRMDGADVATGTVDSNGDVLFAQQTFVPGAHVLQAVAGELTSVPVTVTAGALCPRVDVVLPVLPGDGSPVVLGPPADRLLPACGEQFGIDVVLATDAPDGTRVTLLVNGSPRTAAVVEGTVVRFSTVVLGNRGATPNRLAVELDGDATRCRTDIPNELRVDCEGVSCEIISPRPGFLNASDDRSLEDGFQGDFQVATDLSAVSQPIGLIVDGDALDLRTLRPTVMGQRAVATFPVALSEGVHRMIALCSDGFGNTTSSGQITWTVDTVPCGTTITAPRLGAFIVDADDLDSALDGVQIELSANVTGGDCERARAAVCGGLGPLPLLPISGSTTVSRLTLATAYEQNLCLEVVDRAGNLSFAQTTIYYQSDAPRVAIESPVHGRRFNRLGNDHAGVPYDADLDPDTSACDVAFRVRCSELSAPVRLHEHVSGIAIDGATATCEPSQTPTATYPGVAVFSSVTLPEGDVLAVDARQIAAGGRLTGTSAPITLRTDCHPPSLSIDSLGELLCGAVVGPRLVPGSNTPTITRDVLVTTDDEANVHQVRLQVVPTAGGSPIADMLATEQPFYFDNVNFSALGEYNVQLTAVDQAGNAAHAPECVVSIADAPALSLTIAESEDADNVIESEDDCDPRAGLQVLIHGRTNAPDGSAVALTVGGTTHLGTTTCDATDCGYSFCVDMPQGRVQVRVRITDPNKPTVGAIEREVIVDSLPPLQGISTLTAVVPEPAQTRTDRVLLRWTDVFDQGDLALVGYELRCASAPIMDEAMWNAAPLLPLASVPGTSGGQRAEEVSGFRLYETRHCMLRGYDVAHALTPIVGSRHAVIDFLGLRTDTLAEEDPVRIGGALSALGDINGDGHDDVLVGGTGLSRVYFGADGFTLATARTMTIVGPGDGFGASVAGVGDLDGDEVMDFAISDADTGNVYLLFGRDEATHTAFPAQLDVLASDALVLGASVDDGFGTAIAALGDLDGDGRSDMAIGAPAHGLGAGRVYVLLGRARCDTDLTTHCLPTSSARTLGDTGGDLDGFVIDPAATIAGFGRSVVGLGQVALGDNDLDPVRLAIGAPGSIVDSIDAYLWLGEVGAYPTSATGLLPVSALVNDATGLLVHTGGPEQASQTLAVVELGQLPSLAVATDNAVTVLSLQNTLNAMQPITSVGIVNLGGASTDGFGRSIGLGRQQGLSDLRCDVNGDGTDALWIGTAGSTGVGAAHLYYGDLLEAQKDINSAVPRSSAVLTATSVGGPRVVACVGDLNGDGAPDLMSGDPDDSQDRGLLTLYY